MIGKFRVFNKKFGAYHDFEDLVIDMNGKLLDRDRRVYNQGDYVIEWCTGLPDKNGKLIYQGDKLKYNQPIVENGKQIFIENKFIVTNGIMNLYKIFCLRSMNNLEIIGTIHEVAK